MAKEKAEETKTEVQKTDRELRWEALEVAYAKQNPAKYALKKEAGKFDIIPTNFL